MEFVTGVREKETLELSKVLAPESLDQEVLTDGSIYSIRNMGEIAFVILRKRDGLLQTVWEEGKTNLSIEDVGGEILVVSQFTLLADCKKGRRPSFIKAGDPKTAEEMYELFIEECKKRISKVEHGSFGSDMKVELVNDGPFTIILDSD